MPQTFDIITEPAGDTYRALLAFAADFSGSFSLVWRHQLSVDIAAAVLEGVLRPFLLEAIEVRSGRARGSTAPQLRFGGIGYHRTARERLRPRNVIRHKLRRSEVSAVRRTISDHRAPLCSARFSFLRLL